MSEVKFVDDSLYHWYDKNRRHLFLDQVSLKSGRNHRQIPMISFEFEKAAINPLTINVPTI